MREIVALWAKHRSEIEALRKRCVHPKNGIIIRDDDSSAGCGSRFPAVYVTCSNCGKQKVIFGLDGDQRKRVVRQMSRQGWTNERLGLHAEFYWELTC